MGGTTNTVDLSNEGIRNVLFALSNEGVEVHYYETDGDTALDVWLSAIGGDAPTVLSWRDVEGWLLQAWDSDDTKTPPARKWPIAAGSPSEVARDVATILAEGGAK